MKKNLKRARQMLLFLTFGLTTMLTENALAQTCAAPLSLTINDCDNYTINDLELQTFSVVFIDPFTPHFLGC